MANKPTKYIKYNNLKIYPINKKENRKKRMS